jgi:all-trans-retinol 13,14-reductase
LEVTDVKQEEYDAIVIGSGMGGLTSAALMSRAGLRTLVLEHHFAVGGNAQCFRRKKMFDFDVGLHYIGDCGPGGLFPVVMKRLGLADKVEFLPMDQDGFDTLIYPDLKFRVPAGWENYESRLKKTFPEEARAIERFVAFMKALGGRTFAGPTPELEALERRLNKPWDACTLGDVFDSLECSLRLRSVLSAESGTYGAPPSRVTAAMHASLLDHYMKGAYYVRGGSRALIDALVGAIEESGSQIRLRSRVKRILVEGGRVAGVELAKGEVFRARYIVSNADAKRTFLEMVGEERISADLRERLHAYRMALPLFIVYLGLQVDPRDLGLRDSNYFLFPSYDPEEDYAACYAGEVPERPGALITIASLKDPESRNIAPEGYTNLQIMSIAPAQLSSWGVEQGPASGGRYRHTMPYTVAKRTLEERLLQVTEEMMPGLLRNIVWRESATPLTQERFTLSTGGTSYGFEHTPDQFGERRLATQTEIPGLYLAGANTLFGHGIGGAMVSGVAAGSAVIAAAS